MLQRPVEPATHSGLNFQLAWANASIILLTHHSRTVPRRMGGAKRYPSARLRWVSQERNPSYVLFGVLRLKGDDNSPRLDPPMYAVARIEAQCGPVVAGLNVEAEHDPSFHKLEQLNLD